MFVELDWPRSHRDFPSDCLYMLCLVRKKREIKRAEKQRKEGKKNKYWP